MGRDDGLDRVIGGLCRVVRQCRDLTAGAAEEVIDVQAEGDDPGLRQHGGSDGVLLAVVMCLGVLGRLVCQGSEVGGEHSVNATRGLCGAGDC